MWLLCGQMSNDYSSTSAPPGSRLSRLTIAKKNLRLLIGVQPFQHQQYEEESERLMTPNVLCHPRPLLLVIVGNFWPTRIEF